MIDDKRYLSLYSVTVGGVLSGLCFDYLTLD